MPFIEVIDRDAAKEIREVATRDMTDGLCQAFGIKPEIVTCYYFSAPHYSYGHAGKYGEFAENFRIFIKVHAFPRPPEAKAEAARALTDAAVAAYGTDPKQVIVYFFDRDPADAFHGGMASG
ncbi:4-oxalocrotonate tautomerase family protein [Salipiger manganoxidans]|uniref:tautomerase family protein n=1 Tax=Salipiger marinus TaxID=555512 RepID=UPI001E50C474|nr:tautomerase family protein [Salipiger manganoxidans]MCD1617721.1 4-oxalocrotonate tautomerase family protein [Salipiger manganoxidans]